MGRRICGCSARFLLERGGFLGDNAGSFWGDFKESPSSVFVPDKWFRQGAADAIWFSGATPEEVYQPGAATIPGPIVGLVAGNVLARVGVATYGQPITGLPDDPLGVGFADASNDSFDATNAAVHSYDGITQPFAILSVENVTFADATQRLVSLAKRLPANRGHGCTMTNTLLRLFVHGALGIASTNVPAWAGLGYTFYGVSVAANRAYLRAPTGAASIANFAAAIGDMTNASIAALGAQYTFARGHNAGPQVIWSGPGAEIALATAPIWLPAWWSS